MYPLYNTLILLLTLLLSPLIAILLCTRKKYRRGFLQKCGFLPADIVHTAQQRRPIWLHAVSVGEVMAAATLAKALKKTFPESPLLLSTVTETGYRTAQRNVPAADSVVFFPLDYPLITERVVRRLRPRAFVALETEIWPNLLRSLARHGVPAMIASGRISSKSYPRYRLLRPFFRRVLGNISCFCMQTQSDADRIIDIGAPAQRVIVTGNVKFDQQVTLRSPEEQDAVYRALGVSPDRKVIIAGSTHRGEEEIVLEAFRALRQTFTDLTLVLAPRHPERFAEVEELLRRLGCAYTKKTLLGAPPRQPAPEVLLLDTIGDLAELYSIGTIIFIGGSLISHVGGHNVLEPASHSKPVLFGPHMANFSEIAGNLIRRNAALQVAGTGDFIRLAAQLLDNPERCRQMGETAAAIIRENSGAVQKCISALRTLSPDMERTAP
jgi:3-deoxy-D-manno-octulosonic-acid transferase